MLRLAPLVWIVLGTTLAGILMLVVVSVPSLASQDARLIPYAVASGFLIAVPLAILIARRIMAGIAKPA